MPTGKPVPFNHNRAKDSGVFSWMRLNNVNDMQNSSNDLVTQSIINPDSIDPQDVTIALSEATLALNITRTVFDRAVQAYNNVINMR